jgi:hypothetical protein
VLDRRPRRARDCTLLAERHGVAIAAVALTSRQVATDASITAADAMRRLRQRRRQILTPRSFT